MMANSRVGKTISDDRLEELQFDFDGWSRDALGKAGSFDRDVAAAMMELRARRRAGDEKESVPRSVLERAVEVIKTWHNMGGAEGVWDIYWRNAPEMRPIREALARPTDEKIVLCPHGMPLAENICGPCSEGHPNRPSGIPALPILAGDAAALHAWMTASFTRLRDALAGEIGLVQLLAGRDDLRADRDAILRNHRHLKALTALQQSGSAEPAGDAAARAGAESTAALANQSDESIEIGPQPDMSEVSVLRRDVIGVAAYELSQFITAAHLTDQQKARLREINQRLVRNSTADETDTGA